MDIAKTQRGFNIIEFEDLYGGSCSLQKSSLAFDPAIWFGKKAEVKYLEKGKGWEDFKLPEGVKVFSRMQLNQEQVAELLPYLQNFVETGELNSKEVKAE